ncbi:MAG: hypothetical protein FWG61_05320 [Firmicutes bacterium]|nr:hypothetical protein [Bacillota bacterium]
MNKAGLDLALKLLIVIVIDDRAEKVTELFRERQVLLHYHVRGHGTASSAVLNMLGLDKKEQTVILAVTTRQTAYMLHKRVANKLHLWEAGHGISFIMPLSGISKVALRFLEHEMLREIEKSEESDMSEINEGKKQMEHDLILAVVKRGYSEELMEVARTVGAGGGTVIPAHRVTTAAPLRFWGASLQEEKDIVAIVSKREAKANIMMAINEKYGFKSEAQGWVLSLPVESVAGIAEDED